MKKEYLQNLRHSWNAYKNFHKVTQAKASEQLGWAKATLSLYLSGRRKLGPLHAAELANLLKIDVASISDSAVPVIREFPVTSTVSGNEPPQKTKKTPLHVPREAIFCDIPLLIEGAKLAIPVGTTLLVTDEDPPDQDPRWPSMAKKYWVIRSPTKTRVVLHEIKPKARPGERVQMMTSAIFI